MARIRGPASSGSICSWGAWAGFDCLDAVFGLLQRVMQIVSQPVQYVQRVDLCLINKPDGFGVAMRDNALRFFASAFGDGVFADDLYRLLLSVRNDLFCTRLRIAEDAVPLGDHALAFP